MIPNRHHRKTFHRSWSGAFGAAAILACLAPAAHADGDAPKLEPYGFIRFDGIYDDSPMSNDQFPMWAISEDERVSTKNDGAISVHPRLTRLGLKVAPYTIGEHTTAKGVIEIDFQNGGRESRETPRMRHGYLEVTHNGLSILAGQTWDLIAPLYPAVNADALMWNAGNLGDRKPQARLTLNEPAGKGAVIAAVAATMTGAVDGQDLDGDGVLDGQDFGAPGAQARLGIERPVGSAGKLKAGVWGAWSGEQVGVDRQYDSNVAGFDISIPLHRKVTIEGEGFVGRNLSDVRGGIGQGVVNGHEVHAKGGWGQLVVKPCAEWTLAGGATLDDPDDDDVPSADEVLASSNTSLSRVGRTQNRTFFGSAAWRPAKSFEVGAEYLNWTTEYNGIADGTANRIDTHATLFF